MSRKSWIIAAIVAVALVAVAAFVVVRVTREEQFVFEPASFQVEEARAVAAEGNPDADLFSKRVEAFFNDYYQKAFLDGSRYQGADDDESTPPPLNEALADFFAKDASEAVTRDLGALSINDEANRLAHIEATSQTIDGVSAFVGSDGNAPLYIVATSFKARATPHVERGFFDKLFEGDIERGTVQVSHKGTWWLVPSGDEVRITAYEVSFRMEEVQVQAVWSGGLW